MIAVTVGNSSDVAFVSWLVSNGTFGINTLYHTILVQICHLGAGNKKIIQTYTKTSTLLNPVFVLYLLEETKYAKIEYNKLCRRPPQYTPARCKLPVSNSLLSLA